jgi:hypothetical protein
MALRGGALALASSTDVASAVARVDHAIVRHRFDKVGGRVVAS